METAPPRSRNNMLGRIALAIGLTVSASALTVRVVPAGGAPRLVVNGAPVRARMFWGAPGTAPIPVSPAWKEVRFEFVASGSASNGTMHLRFGQTPGDVYLGDVHMVDLDHPGEPILSCDFESGRDSFWRDWTFWPAGNRIQSA